MQLYCDGQSAAKESRAHYCFLTPLLSLRLASETVLEVYTQMRD